MDSDDVGEKNRVAGSSLLDVSVVGTGLDFEVEDIRSVAFIEDDERLGEDMLALDDIEDDDLVDTGFEEGKIVGRHLAVGRTGARKLTVLRMTTSLFWL